MNKTSKNMIIALLTKVAVIIAGVVAQQFILQSYGSAINGLTSSISQFMTYFMLLEAGLGTASMQALYDPLSKKDSGRISGIYNATSVQYRRTGLVFMGLWTLFSLILPLVSNSGEEEMGYWFIVAVTFLSGVGQIVSYLFVGKYTVLLSADNKIYVLNIIDSLISVANCVIKVLLINAGFGITVVITSVIITTLIRLLILRAYFLKNYKYIDKKVPADHDSTKKRWNVLVHQVVGLVTSHTDVMLLTFFDTLQSVSVYSVYNYIYSNLGAVVTSTFSQAPMATFGKMYATEDKRLKSFYVSFETVFVSILFIIILTALLMTLPFVRLYTSGVEDASYINGWTALLFAVTQLLYMVRIPAIIMVNVSGHFKETQRSAVLEAVINICVSIPLFFVVGMNGLLIGTFAALLYRSADIIYYVYKHLIGRKIYGMLFTVAEHLAVSVAAVAIYRWIFDFNASNWLLWIFKAGVTFAYVCSVFAVNALVLYRKHIRGFIAMMRKNV